MFFTGGLASLLYFCQLLNILQLYGESQKNWTIKLEVYNSCMRWCRKMFHIS